MNWRLKARIIDYYGSQTEFALNMGYSDSYVSRVVRNRVDPPLYEKEEWAEALDCHVADIFGG